MKKKIIIAVIAITVIVSALAICSSAYEREDYYGETIESGTTLVFKDTITVTYFDLQNLSFSSGGTNFVGMKWNSGVGSLTYWTSTTDGSTIAYNPNNSTKWVGSYKTITLRQNYTLQNNTLSNFLIDNIASGLPEPPPPPTPPDENIENVLDNAKATFSTSLNVTSVIIAWLMANTLALCGLYLYILVALIGIAVRFFKK